MQKLTNKELDQVFGAQNRKSLFVLPKKERDYLQHLIMKFYDGKIKNVKCDTIEKFDTLDVCQILSKIWRKRKGAENVKSSINSKN